jgi:UDPglucose--hexose-1-phosphate uridylyltransferase
MIEKTIKECVYYAEGHLYLREDDVIYLTNLLLNYFGKQVPYEGPINKKALDKLEVPDLLVAEIVDYLTKEELLDEAEAFRRADWVMGMLTPLPSEVDDAFSVMYGLSPEKALDYLFELSVHNDYFQKTKVGRNLVWEARYKDGPSLLISINLSKPEKDNKEIAKLQKAPATGYPKCLLCKENLGYVGDETTPSREPLRFVPIALASEDWYLQYSPYGYFDHHCIAFKSEHVPMRIDRTTFVRLLDFVDLFPTFFIGSNSDLPIVGGSILNHEHFQGGLPVLPLLNAKVKEAVRKTKKGTVIEILNFYDTALKIEGADRQDVIDQATKILATWRHYDDPEHQIQADTGSENHNTVTPFAKKTKKGYELFLILRNNLTTKEYPEGLFHAHPEYHAIKKEGIGIIEAAGLFILPARLIRQVKAVEDVVAHRLSEKDYLAKYPDLTIFGPMIAEMEKTGISSREYIDLACQGILRNVAVYKDGNEGQEGLRAFLKEALK